MTQTPHISVQHLNVHIGNQHILNDININIPDKKGDFHHRSIGLRENYPVKII